MSLRDRDLHCAGACRGHRCPCGAEFKNPMRVCHRPRRALCHACDQAEQLASRMEADAEVRLGLTMEES